MKKKIFLALCLYTVFLLITAALLTAVYFYFNPIIAVYFHLGPIAFSPIAAAAGLLFLAVIIVINSTISRILAKNIDKEHTSFIQIIHHEQERVESRMNELINQSEADKSIFENASEGFIMLDCSEVITMANRSARTVFEVGDSCVGDNINVLTQDISFLNKVKAALHGHSGQLVLEILSRNQLHNVSFIPSAGQGVIILITDITERQIAEKIRREFTANVSHELSTPLALTLGFAEIIGEGQAEPDDVIHFVEKIKTETRRMLDMVESILFLSKLDEKDAKETWTKFDAFSVAKEAVESLAPIADAVGIKLSLSGSPCFICGNRLLIYALLTNLISNAIQYNKPKGWVKIAVSHRNYAAYINVSDTGIGIPKDEQSRVFERFYTVGSPDSAGLGLAIVRDIVRHHGGTIELESQPDVGTRVFVKLPDTGQPRI